MINKDSSFEGVFITAVKVTGIFCRPVCTAKKPKPENVTFYITLQEAILNGFCPYQVCNPFEQSSETPSFVKQLFMALSEDPYLRLKDIDLKQPGIEPSQLLSWFKKKS
jgi:AraC family transcriptional regulator, regulatory protein of adaptative response / methylated-DNA-[protein]-cysteine methyltransferase